MAGTIQVDPRDKATVDLHTAMANAKRELINLNFKALADTNKELLTPAFKATLDRPQSNQYPAQMTYGGIGYTVITLDIKDQAGHIILCFLGHSGGVALGGGTVWGTCTLNMPPGSLPKKSGRFVADFYPFAAAVAIYDMAGPLQCAFAGGGLGFAAGIVGGQGDWR